MYVCLDKSTIGTFADFYWKIRCYNNIIDVTVQLAASNILLWNSVTYELSHDIFDKTENK